MAPTVVIVVMPVVATLIPVIPVMVAAITPVAVVLAVVPLVLPVAVVLDGAGIGAELMFLPELLLVSELMLVPARVVRSELAIRATVNIAAMLPARPMLGSAADLDLHVRTTGPTAAEAMAAVRQGAEGCGRQERRDQKL